LGFFFYDAIRRLTAFCLPMRVSPRGTHSFGRSYCEEIQRTASSWLRTSTEGRQDHHPLASHVQARALLGMFQFHSPITSILFPNWFWAIQKHVLIYFLGPISSARSPENARHSYRSGKLPALSLSDAALNPLCLIGNPSDLRASRSMLVQAGIGASLIC
jgi:hypothetical protein